MSEVSPSTHANDVSLSVVICTFNRANLLNCALASLAAQTARKSMEVVVVDNNSADATQEVLQKWCSDQTIRLTAVFEPRQGLSQARNTGIAHAGGSIIAFLDDDVWVPPDWAARILRIFADKPDVDCLTGPVEAQWEGIPPPPWVNDELLFSVGVGQYGPVGRFLTGKEYPFGGNSAYRAGVFVEIGGFDSRLGRIGFDLLSCEEVELAGRLRASGKRIYYDPDVKVRHLVLASRACKAYFLARRYADGRSIAVWEGLRGGKWLVARNAFLRLVLTIVRDVPGYVLTAVVRSERHFTYDCRLAKTSGYLKRVVKILTRGIDGGLVS